MQKYYILVSIQSIFDALLHHFALSILTPYTPRTLTNGSLKPATAARSGPYCPKYLLLDTAKCLLLAGCKRHNAKRHATNNFSKSYFFAKNRF